VAYLQRERRRRTQRVIGVLIVIVIGALAVSAWLNTSGASADKQAAAEKKPPALKPLVPPIKPTPTTRSAIERPVQPAPAPVPKANAPVTIVPSNTQPASGPADATGISRELQAGLKAKKNNKPLEARIRINKSLHRGLSAAEAQIARQALTELANHTLFTRSVIDDDPLVTWHIIQSGDTLGKIAQKACISEDLLAKINGLPDKNFIRQGQGIKVLQGPFHAVISKREHLMHLYLQNVYCRTLRVALGENGSTPTGKWKVSNHQSNPPWTDPRTGKRWHPDDPNNPLGEYWIGLEGIAGNAVGQFGYGIHGTIEPETIGQDVSMGCVRLAADDIAWVYQLLMPGHSMVTIHE